jgi:SAM-dependent methyltransferase
MCHNVLEFAAERAEIVKEFSRILKSGGILSIIKHNKAGRIIRTAVFENNMDMAQMLLDSGGAAAHNAFGDINYYVPEDLVSWDGNLKIEKILGVQTFYGLQQNNEAKYEPGWIDKMFELEMKVCDREPYKNIAFCQHVLLKKI